jgi:peptide/nickel transport system permease protein
MSWRSVAHNKKAMVGMGLLVFFLVLAVFPVDFRPTTRQRSGYIIVAEVIPTLTSLIVASFLGTAVFAVLTAVGLQFVGLGNPNSLSWGNMLYWAQNNEALDTGIPLWAITPGVCIALLGAAFAFLNYAFDQISNLALRPVRRLSRSRRA